MMYSLDRARDIASRSMYVDSISFLGRGNHSDAFCINGDAVIKLPRHRRASQCLQTEMQVLRGLEGSMPVAIPNARLEGTFEEGGETYVYYVSDLLHWRNLSRKTFAGLDADTRERNAEILALFLHRLHGRRDILPIRRRDCVLLHGDLSLNHVLFDGENTVCGILDFADSRIGRPRSDFLYLLDDADEEEFGAEFGRRVLYLYEAYGQGICPE